MMPAGLIERWPARSDASISQKRPEPAAGKIYLAWLESGVKVPLSEMSSSNRYNLYTNTPSGGIFSVHESPAYESNLFYFFIGSYHLARVLAHFWWDNDNCVFKFLGIETEASCTYWLSSNLGPIISMCAIQSHEPIYLVN
jgi:hypothetical protein